ncbi:MAG: SLBB domain-containing protein, partial [Candidatus Firestonebacteria bacterium]
AGGQNISKDTLIQAPVLDNKKESTTKPSIIEELYPDETKTTFIKQFGYEIFGQPATFAPVDNVPVGADYVVGPGDSFVIYLSGKLVQQETINLAVDRDGRVSLPKSGSVFLWGMKFSEAEKLIKDQLSLNYSNFSINITLGKLRTIKVFILGEVVRPGGYTLSSLSTMFHGLYAAGGPTKVGSFRKIKVIRDNKELAVVDLYDFLLTGEKGQDIRLQSGDSIFVPSIGKVAAIRGSVKRPRIYELLGETRLSQVFKMAGGISPTGYLNRIQIERIANNEKKTVFDFEARNVDTLAEKDVPVKDGDLISIFPINKTKYGYVSISGNVNMPGEYQLAKDMKLKDLLEKARGVLPGTYIQRAEIIRYRDERKKAIISFDLGKLLKGDEKENLELREWDQVVIYTLSNVIPVQKVQISGAVNRELKIDLAENMKVSDVIFRAGGLKATAMLDNAELFHLIPGEQPEVRKINLRKVLIDKDPTEDIVLQGNDHLFVREDVSWTRKKTVTLSGEFKYPGIYVANYEEKLSSLIERAGGVTEKSFLQGVVFTRESAKISQQKAMVRYLERLQAEVAQARANAQAQSTTDAGIKIVNDALKSKEEVSKLYASIDVPGRIIIKIENLASLKDSKNDIILEENDAIYLPQTPSSVNVIGSVYNSAGIIYEPYRNISYYIDKVGGTTPDANRGDVYLIRASGEVDKNNAWGTDVQKGDTVVVPAKFSVETNWFKMFLDLSQIVYQTSLGGLAISKW